MSAAPTKKKQQLSRVGDTGHIKDTTRVDAQLKGSEKLFLKTAFRKIGVTLFRGTGQDEVHLHTPAWVPGLLAQERKERSLFSIPGWAGNIRSRNRHHHQHRRTKPTPGPERLKCRPQCGPALLLFQLSRWIGWPGATTKAVPRPLQRHLHCPPLVPSLQVQSWANIAARIWPTFSSLPSMALLRQKA